MKMKPYSIAFAIALSGMIQPAYAGDRAADLNNMLNSLSDLLSSTNPKPPNFKNIEPGTGDAIAAQDNTRQRIAGLPPLSPPSIHAGYSQIASAAANDEIPPPSARIIQPQVDYNRLSPETRRILEATPSGIGSLPKQRPENISMKRGDFDPEYGQLLDGPIDQTENPEDAFKPGKLRKLKAGEVPSAETARKSKFDMKVQNAKINDTLINILDKALRALSAGQYEVSIALYKSALLKDSRNRDAMFGLATAYQKAGQRAQARDAYGKLLAQYPTFQPGLNNLLVLASTESPQGALKELNAIGARNPNFAPVYAEKASIYTQGGDNLNAKRNYIKALNIDPDNIIYRYDLAVLLDKSGDIINAAKLYNQILDQSAKGAKLPVERSQIEERLAFIGSIRANRT